MGLKSRILEFIDYKGITVQSFEKIANLSNAAVDKMGDNTRMTTLDKISNAFPNLDINWLRTGEGTMLKEEKIQKEENPQEVEKREEEIYTVPLLPISAIGGSLNDFVVSVKASECERIISPIKGADFAIPIAGDSMAPEYPNGSLLFIKKINERAFIDWGKAYVLDTCNGVVIKKLMPVEGNKECVQCVSINPDYPPFEVSYEDIYGVYRVMICMTLK